LQPFLAPWKSPGITLRYYQQEAKDAVYKHLRERSDNPCVVIPTGGGKTPVIATICRDAVKQWNGRVVVLAHVKELLQQLADKLAVVAPDVDFGIYSASLKSRDKKQPVIIAGIQSVYERACDFEPFDLAIVDEAHLIPPDGEGMYRQFLADAKVVNPSLRVIGLTATPFRMHSGEICTPDGILNSICYEIGVKQLIVEGFLSPLISKAGKTRVDTSSLHVRGGEFIPSEVESLMDDDGLVQSACEEIVEYTVDRKAVLIFSAGVDHALHVCNTLEHQFGQSVGFVWGEMKPDARELVIQSFLAGNLKYLVNVNVLTTGFDAPHVDCVALLRPTLSPGLYYQMVGRGFRLSPGKDNCLVLDFGSNVLRHGPVDSLKVKARKIRERDDDREPAAKECPQCQVIISVGYSRCPECNFEFPVEKAKHDSTASDAEVLSGVVKTADYEVQDVYFGVHVKKNNPDGPQSMRVDYIIGVGESKSEWICFEHEGFARQKACQWWTKRSPDPIPSTAEEAVQAAKNGALAETKQITVRSVSGDPYERIVGYELGGKPEPINPLDNDGIPPPAVLIENDDGTQTRFSTLAEYDRWKLDQEIPF